MSWEQSLNLDRGWVYTRYFGSVVTNDLVESREALWEGVPEGATLRLVVEVDPEATLALSGSDVRTLATKWADEPAAPGDSWTLAVIASAPDHFGFARMYEQIRSRDPDQVRVFRDRQEGLAWARVLERATLGGGCFWCLEAVYARMTDVVAVQSGFAGGRVVNPAYREVCGGTTGHAEVVQITFDPTRLSYEEILRIFFTIHDPTTLNRQGADVGDHYRSIILYHDQTQEAVARRVMEEVTESGIWSDPLVTERVPLEGFYPAGAEHHRYFEKNPRAAYCRFVVEPKVAKARRLFAHRFEG